MKRLVGLLTLVALPFTASASPELASDWGIKASDLYQTTVSLIETVETSQAVQIPSAYETEIGRFAVTAGQLGSWVDGNDGPSDLGCIFRGMAAEGEDQLMALEDAETADATHASLKRLASMFSDAEMIAVAAIHANDEMSPAPSGETPLSSCQVDPAASKAALH